MHKEEKIAKSPKLKTKISKQRSNTKSKNGKKKDLADTTKRIKDYFPSVPRCTNETQETSGMGVKDETRVTDHTTPDKAIIQNAKSQVNGGEKGKHTHSG